MDHLYGYARAHDLVLRGHAIKRNGWNGAGQYVFVLPQQDGLEPCLALRNAQGKIQPGWVPSQGDMFAQDWTTAEVVKPEEV